MKCDVEIPEIHSAMPAKQQTGLRNAVAFKSYVEEGLASGTLPLNYGVLNRTLAAIDCKFGRSAFAQNEWINAIALWADKELKGKGGRRPSGGAPKSEREKELTCENQRLKDRNVTLNVDLDESQRKLRQLGYIEKIIQNGDVRLPW